MIKQKLTACKAYIIYKPSLGSVKITREAMNIQA